MNHRRFTPKTDAVSIAAIKADQACLRETGKHLDGYGVSHKDLAMMQKEAGYLPKFAKYPRLDLELCFGAIKVVPQETLEASNSSRHGPQREVVRYEALIDRYLAKFERTAR